MLLSPCQRCGAARKRIHRTLLERLIYSEVYQCKKCNARTRKRRYFPLPNIRHAHYVKCPRCHNVDLSLLTRRDTVDTMQGGIMNLLHRIAGGKLYHCWFCRLQFYDRRLPFERLKPVTAPDSETI